MGFILFIIAYILLLPLTLINFFIVRKKGYFRDTALSIDVFANREFRATWNKFLIKHNGYKFGKNGETISSVLGKNQLKGTLTKTGYVLVRMLDKIEDNHCIKSIDNNI